MSESTTETPIVTRNVCWILLAGIVAILLLTYGLLQRRSEPVPEVVMAPELTLDEARRLVWFSLPQPASLPDGMFTRGAKVIGDDWVAVTFVSKEKNWIEVGKGIKRPTRDHQALPKNVRQTTMVNGHLAVFIQGEFDDNGDWQSGIDYSTLEWSSKGFNYRISQKGMQMDYKALVKLAESVIVKPDAGKTQS